jgi:hypothetical protein
MPRRVQWLLSALIVACAVGVLVVPQIRPSRWYIDPLTNSNFAEATSLLLQGDLGLDAFVRDTVIYEGEVYSVYPPAFTFISLAMIAPQKFTLGPDDPPFMLPALLIVVIFVPLPILAFWMFARCTKDPARTGMWTLYWLAGCATLPVLVRCYDGSMYYVNHAVSQTGLLLIFGGLAGKSRIWISLIGLVVAAWSRQLTLAYVIPILWVVLRQRGGRSRLIGLIAVLATVGVIGGVLMLLNGLKFGDPFESGYTYLFEQWPPAYYEYDDGQPTHGLFSVHYALKNLWYMFVALPGTQSQFLPALRFQWWPQNYGISLFCTSPVLLLVLFDVRRWWRDGLCRWVMLATLPVIAALLCYQNTGWPQPGYHRFSLDFVLPWMMVVAAGRPSPRRMWLVAAMLAWSVWYYQVACQLKLPGGGA